MRIVSREDQAADRRIANRRSVGLAAIQDQKCRRNDWARNRCNDESGNALNGVSVGAVVVSIERQLAGGQPGAVALGKRTGVADGIDAIFAAICRYSPDPTTQSPS